MEEESAPSAGARGLSPAGVLRPARFSLRRWGELGWSSRRGRTGAEEQESAVDVGVWNGWTENIWARITAYQAMASIKRSKLLAIPAKAWPSGRPRYAWSPHKRSLRGPRLGQSLRDGCTPSVGAPVGRDHTSSPTTGGPGRSRYIPHEVGAARGGALASTVLSKREGAFPEKLLFLLPCRRLHRGGRRSGLPCRWLRLD